MPIRDQRYVQSHVPSLINRLLGGSSNVDIIVATPGRLIDHITSTPNFSLQHLRFLVSIQIDNAYVGNRRGRSTVASVFPRLAKHSHLAYLPPAATDQAGSTTATVGCCSSCLDGDFRYGIGLSLPGETAISCESVVRLRLCSAKNSYSLPRSPVIPQGSPPCLYARPNTTLSSPHPIPPV